MKNAPRNDMFIAHSIQNDNVKACFTETTNTIIRDIGDALFSILINESHDVSMKEHIVIAL